MLSLAMLANDAQSSAQAVLSALQCYQKLHRAHPDIEIKIVSSAPLVRHITTASSHSENTHSTMSVSTLTQSHISLLSALGLSFQDLLKHCNAQIHYADKVCNMLDKEKISTAYCSIASMGVSLNGVDFHHMLNHTRLYQHEALDLSLSSYSLNGTCQRMKKSMLPSNNPNNIRSSLKINVNVQSELLLNKVAPLLSKLNIHLAYTENWHCTTFQHDDPLTNSDKVGFIKQIGQSEVGADYFIDLRKNKTELQSTIKTFVTENTVEQGLYMSNGHVIQTKRLGNASLVRYTTLYKQAETNSSTATPALSCEQIGQLIGAPNILISDAPAIVYQSLLDSKQPMWTKNLLCLSDVELFNGINVSAGTCTYEKIIDTWLMYFLNTASEHMLNLCNEQFEQVLLGTYCFDLMPCFIHDADAMTTYLSTQSFNLLYSPNFTEDLLNTINKRANLFAQKGTDYLVDHDLVPREVWVNLYLALQVWPKEVDVVSFQVDDIKGMLRKLQQKFAHAIEH
ncbi:hypothetical protein [Agaribacter flavus]|uniref:Uncharacterized protein n=1 Tax=Agaribacter flavus TaxID=1902781 RepID=A0ABV7FM70_9ALTE